MRLPATVFRLAHARDNRPLRGDFLIDAVGEPPPTPEARVYDAGGLLAEGSKRETWRWSFTERGEARVVAEADGWLDAFLDGRVELAPATWGRS